MMTFARGSTFHMMGQFLLDGDVKDISQWRGLSVTLADYQGNNVFATLSTEVVDAPNGVVRVWADDTTTWPVGRTRIDCQVIDSFGNPYNAQCDYFRIVESMLNPARPIISPT